MNTSVLYDMDRVRGRAVAVLVVFALVLSLVPAVPASASPVRTMSVGDSVTAGGTAAADTYRYRLYQHYASSSVDWVPVGPYHGVGSASEDPAVGYGAWPEPFTFHAAEGSRTVANLTRNVQSWVSSYTPDVLLAFPAFVRQDEVTQEQLEAFIDAARAGRSDLKILFGAPYYGSPFSQAQTDQYRARLAAAVASRDSSASPIRVVDMGVGWSQQYHGAGGTQGRYPAEPEGNQRVAMRWADALEAYWGIGAAVPAASVRELSVTDTGLSWAFDDRADAWQIELDGQVVSTDIWFSPVACVEQVVEGCGSDSGS